MRYIFILLFLVVCFIHIHSVDIGSDTAVTRFNTQQTVQNGDRIAGFASLAAGFRFASLDVSGTFDCFFSVEGDVALNNGILILNQDLIFHNLSSFVSLGDITGNNHVLELSPKMTCIPSGESSPGCAVTFLTNLTTDAAVNSVSWSFDSEYVVIGTDDPGGAGTQVNVYSWDGSNLNLEAGLDVGGNVFAVAWHPSNDWIAVARASGGGAEVYNLSFNRITPGLSILSSIDLGGGGGNSANDVAWHPLGGHLAIGCDANANELLVYAVNGSGVFGSNTSLNLAADVNAVDFNIDGTLLAAGTDSTGGADELLVYTFNAGALTLTLESSFDVGQQVASVSWNKAIGISNLIAIGNQGGSDRIQVYRHTTGTLTFVDGDSGTSVNSVHWRLAGNCLAAGLNNNSEGTGGELRLYGFNDDALIQDDDQEIGENILAVRWGPSGRYLATGDDGLDAGDPTLAIYEFVSDQTNLDLIQFSDLQIFFNNNITFKDVLLTFSGNNTINGRGNTLTLAPTFTLQVGQNSGVLFKNMSIAGLRENIINGFDNTSTVSFQNVSLILDEDYTFTLGSIELLGDLQIIGEGNSFNYTSVEQFLIRGSSLLSHNGGCDKGYLARLILERDVTFNYAPINNANNLLILEDQMAQIVMHSATINTTSPLVLIAGTLLIDGRSSITGTGGLTLGNGSPVNNLNIKILPAANLEVFNSVVYSNF